MDKVRMIVYCAIVLLCMMYAVFRILSHTLYYLLYSRLDYCTPGIEVRYLEGHP